METAEMNEINNLIAEAEYNLAKEACKRHLHYRRITLDQYTSKISEIDSQMSLTPSKPTTHARGTYDPRNWSRIGKNGLGVERELTEDF